MHKEQYFHQQTDFPSSFATMSFHEISKSYGSAVDARMDAMQKQLDNMQLQLQAVLELLPPPPPPADETRPSASSGSPFPAQPPPPPGNPPQLSVAAFVSVSGFASVSGFSSVETMVCVVRV